jgi:predicted permease
LSVLANEALDVWQELRLDWRVLLMTLAVSVLTSILFGLLPALRAARIDVRAGLTEGGSRGIAGAASRWPRRLLVAGEIAMSMMLLVGAGLLIRTFLHLRELTPGFDGRNVLAASLSLQDARYATTAAGNRLFTESLERIRALPGVESAAVALHVPYERWLNDGFRWPAAGGAEAQSHITTMNYITPGYFRTLRVPLVAGRDFDDRDTADAPPAAIVNQAFVRRYLKDRDVIGKVAFAAGKKTPRIIVGVVGDVQQRPSFGDFGPLAPMPAMYIPAPQMPDAGFRLIHTWFSPKWIIRATGPRDALIAGMRRAVEQSDPLLPFASFKTIDEFRDQTLTHQRLQAALLGSLAGLALILAAVGIYGLIANSVAQRAREIGIRMALGASVGRAVATIAIPGIGLALASVAAGCLLSLASVRVLRSSVFGINILDPVTFAGVGGLLLFISVMASIVPALKVTRLNAADMLRDE